jgi:hypothetical protein
MHYITKANFNNDLRRLRVAQAPTFAELAEKLAQLYPALEARSITTSYLDDEGDNTTIASNADLHECLHVAEQDKRASLHLKATTPERSTVATDVGSATGVGSELTFTEVSRAEGS